MFMMCNSVPELKHSVRMGASRAGTLCSASQLVRSEDEILLLPYGKGELASGRSSGWLSGGHE